MTKLKLLHLKNDMLAANFLANFIAAELVQVLIFKAEDHESMTTFDTMMMIFVAPLAVITLLIILLRVARAHRRPTAR